MQFTRDDSTGLTIRSIERNAIRIGDDIVTTSVALNAERIIDEWNVVSIDGLNIADLEPVLADRPELLVLGTGWEQRLPPRDLMFALARQGIGLEMMDTPAACRTFNILVAEGRRPAAVLLLD